jgi:hypothetical protein
MRIWLFVPGEAIGPLRIGMKREEVRRILGEPSAVRAARQQRGISFPETDYFWENSLQITYAQDRVDFIGANRGGPFDLLWEEQSLFSTTFTEITEAIARYTPVDTTDTEYPTTWRFPAWGLCLWRSCQPEDVDPELRSAGDRSGIHADQVSLVAPTLSR